MVVGFLGLFLVIIMKLPIGRISWEATELKLIWMLLGRQYCNVSYQSYFLKLIDLHVITKEILTLKLD